MRNCLAGSIVVVAAMLAFSTAWERPDWARAARQEPIKAPDMWERMSHRPLLTCRSMRTIFREFG